MGRLYFVTLEEKICNILKCLAAPLKQARDPQPREQPGNWPKIFQNHFKSAKNVFIC